MYEEILREFNKMKVKYVLVGGIAVNFHGYARLTMDMDILADMTDDNLKKIITILKKMGYRVKQPVDPMGIANSKIRHDWIHNKNMKAFNFYKEQDFKQVDILIAAPISYKEAKKNAVKEEIDDMIISVISLNDLIKMKKDTGREQDKKDVEQLRIIKRI